MKALIIGLIILVISGIGSTGLGATKEATAQSPQTSVEALIQQGPALLAQGEFKQVLSFISALPVEQRNDIKVRCLECFANLAAWRSTNAAPYKTAWQEMRRKLIYAGDNEVTPLLAVLLQDKDAFVREYAAELLGYCGDKRALATLQAAKDDDNRGVRKYAEWAHKQIAGGLTADLPLLAAPRVQIPVAMDRAGPITPGRSVSFVNGTEDFKITLVGVVSNELPIKNCYADLESWTDMIIDQLETELQKRGVRVMTPGGPDARRVVIGVLDVEPGRSHDGYKMTLMGKLGQRPLVRIVDIPEYSSLAELFTDGQGKAEAYRDKYQVDMLLHIDRLQLNYDFSLIDLHTKKIYTATLVTEGGSLDELTAEKLSDKVLANPYLNRVLRTKKKSAAMAAPAGDLVFSVWVKDVTAGDGAVLSRCIGTVLVKQQGGQWTKTYPFNNVSGSSTQRAIDGALYKAVEAMLKDPAFRKALSP